MTTLTAATFSEAVQEGTWFVDFFAPVSQSDSFSRAKGMGSREAVSASRAQFGALCVPLRVLLRVLFPVSSGAHLAERWHLC